MRYVRNWKTAESLPDAVEAELRHVLIKQGDMEAAKSKRIAEDWRMKLIGADLENPALSPRDFLHFWTAWAFVRRNSEPDIHSQP